MKGVISEAQAEAGLLLQREGNSIVSTRDEDYTSIHELDEAFLRCRTLGHAWDQIPDDGGHGRQYTESRSTRRITFRCTECHTVREEAWSAVTGDVLFRTYTNPQGYKMAAEDGKRTAMRVEWVQRLGTLQHEATRKPRRSNGKVVNIRRTRRAS